MHCWASSAGSSICYGGSHSPTIEGVQAHSGALQPSKTLGASKLLTAGKLHGIFNCDAVPLHVSIGAAIQHCWYWVPRAVPNVVLPTSVSQAFARLAASCCMMLGVCQAGHMPTC